MAFLYIVLRLLSLVLIVLALMMLGADVLTTLEKGGAITVRSIEQVWALISAGGPAAFKAWLESALPATVAGWIESILTLPGWGVCGVLGVILAFLFGRRVADVS